MYDWGINKNIDICVPDHFARAVVMVNKTKKLRFTYIGRPTESSTNEQLTPVGITTDSQSRTTTLYTSWNDGRSPVTLATDI